MDVKRQILLSLIILSFIALAVCAAESDFNTGISAEKNQIRANESAIFVLDVFSSSPRIETFTIYSDVEWTLLTLPAEDKNLKVFPRSSAQTRVLLRPKSEARIFPGAYQVRVYLKNVNTGEVITNNVIVHIMGSGDYLQDYLPSVRSEVSTEKLIDPRQEISIKVTLENLNPLDIEALDLFIMSDLIAIQDQVSLAALEKKTLTYPARLSATQAPMEDLIKLSLKTETDGRVFEFNSVPLPVQVIEYGGIEEKKEVSKSFLKRTIAHTMTNTGNVDRQHTFRLKRNIFKALFQKFDDDPALIDKHYTWTMTIPVSGSYTIEEKTNYQPLGIAILAVIVIFLLYITFRSPVLIKKSMTVTSRTHGGISAINVQIDIQNRSTKPITHIMIKDKISNMFDLRKDFDVGTLHPDQILKHDKKGTIIRWSLEDIEPLEERIITYKLISKLNIIGKFTLPRASLTFREGKKTKIIHSNSVLMTHGGRE